MSDQPAVATIDSKPAPGQTVEHEGVKYNTIKEGLAHILVPPNAKTITDPKATKQESGDKAQNVFYNPIQQFNRDLSVLAIRAFSEDFAERRKQRAEKKSEGALKKRERKEQARREREAKKAAQDGAVSETTQAVPEVSVDAPNETNGDAETKKRKADQVDESESGPSKRVKSDLGQALDGTADEAAMTDVTVAATTESAAPKSALDPGPIDPEAASKAPTGQRPDDKLRSTMRILDALSATGLRALRYASELPLPVSVTANDLLPTATAAIKLNVRHNSLTNAIHPTTSNAQAHMYNAAFGFSSHAYGKYDVIDLDPYGTAVPFLDSALLALNDPGLLCVTCTDAGVFNSMGYLEKTFALYGGLPMKGAHAHEAGLRLILHSIATAAAKHGLAIEPLLSLSIDFYARVFVRVRRAPADVKFLASKTMTVATCDAGCGAWTAQPLARTSTSVGTNGQDFFKYHPAQTAADTRCAHCGFRTHLAGPMWGGPLHNPHFISRILAFLPALDGATYATLDRVEGMLSTALDELDVLPAVPATDNSSSSSSGLIPPLPPHMPDPHPFAFSPSALARVVHCQAPPEAALRGALRGLGYVATRSHTKGGLVKTQAPWAVVWDVVRAWVATRAPVKEGSVRLGTAGWGVLYGGGDKDGERKKEKEEEEEGGEGEGTDKGQGTEKKNKEIVFDEALGKDKAKGRKLVRYQINPRDNWGPMSRAKG